MNITLSLASRSKLGVRTMELPTKPARSGRCSSVMRKRMLGYSWLDIEVPLFCPVRALITIHKVNFIIKEANRGLNDGFLQNVTILYLRNRLQETCVFQYKSDNRHKKVIFCKKFRIVNKKWTCYDRFRNKGRLQVTNKFLEEVFVV